MFHLVNTSEGIPRNQQLLVRRNHPNFRPHSVFADARLDARPLDRGQGRRVRSLRRRRQLVGLTLHDLLERGRSRGAAIELRRDRDERLTFLAADPDQRIGMRCTAGVDELELDLLGTRRTRREIRLAPLRPRELGRVLEPLAG